MSQRSHDKVHVDLFVARFNWININKIVDKAQRRKKNYN